ncbi:hypothetical protein Tco_1524886 [Tanacetum coccineum]
MHVKLRLESDKATGKAIDGYKPSNIQGVCGALDGAVNISGPSDELDGAPTLPDDRDMTKIVEKDLVVKPKN